jgi:hypothetical protein
MAANRELIDKRDDARRRKTLLQVDHVDMMVGQRAVSID